jgi:uncharacterized protein (DUF2147 family)
VRPARLRALALAAALATAPGAVPATTPPAGADVVGEWWTPGLAARVRIEPCGDGRVCGRIAWLWDETPPGIADRRPLLGRPVIERMRPTAPARWSEGRLYNPEDGRDYTGSLTLRDAATLVVEGCVLFVCRTQLWRRAEPGRCPVAP